MNNSSGYLNTLLFLIYLFVAIFILLSMFLAILAEAQVAVRAEEAEQREDPAFREFGVLSHTYEASARFGGRCRSLMFGEPPEDELDAVGENVLTPSASSGQSDGEGPIRSLANDGEPLLPGDGQEVMRMMIREMQKLQGQVELLRAQVASEAGTKSTHLFNGSSSGGGSRSTSPIPKQDPRMPVWSIIGSPAPAVAMPQASRGGSQASRGGSRELSA